MKDFDYSTQAKYYDILEDNPQIQNFNKVLDKLLLKYDIKTVRDNTCGTGAQSIYLHKNGYQLTASDFSKEMVDIAQQKYPEISFHQADMRTAKFGKSDAVISIFNAIWHLSKPDFEEALQNISDNLEKQGLYVFDIFNMDFMKNNFVSHEFIDTCKEVDGTKYVRFNKNQLDTENSIMNINQKTYIQEWMDEPEIVKSSWDMQIYSCDELETILEDNWFEVLEFLSMDWTEFDKQNSLSILTVARKK